MDEGLRGLGAPRLLRSIPGAGLALVLSCALSTACASGGSGTSSTGPRTERVSVGNPIGSLGSVEITTDASVQESTIPATPAAVWSVLPSVFETMQIETPTIDPRSFMIGNPGYRPSRIMGMQLSTYLDCGNTFIGLYADRYQVTLYFMVQLADPLDGGTRLRTVIDASARPRDVRGNPLHCVSKGTLERRFLELVSEKLAGGGS